MHFEKKINALSKGEFALDENIDSKLEFYSKHKMKNKYSEFIKEVIAIKITPFEPEDVIATDQSAQNLLVKLEDNQRKGLTSATGRTILKNKSTAFKKSSLLNNIASTLYSFYGDEINLRQALEYAELATEYLDIPEVRLTRGKILKKLNRKEESIEQANLGLQSKLLDWRIKSDLIGFRKSFIN